MDGKMMKNELGEGKGLSNTYSNIKENFFRLSDLVFIEDGASYLVTGANGFIGSSIVFALLELNLRIPDKQCKIIIAVRNYNKAIEKYGEILENESVNLIVCDNKEEILIEEKIDYIICAAAVTKKENIYKYPINTLVDNVLGVYHCLELAKNKKVKGVVFVSSVQVYGKVSKEKINEVDFGPLDCMDEKSIYPESKRFGEMLCWAYNKQYNVPTKCIRLFHVYGEGEKFDNGTFLSDFFGDIIAGRDINIKGDGKEIRNLCYVSDVIRGIFYVLHKGKSGEAYNIGSESSNCTIEQIAELMRDVAERLGRRARIIVGNKRGDGIISKQVPDVGKLKNLGWKEEDGDMLYNFKIILMNYLFR